MLTIQRSVISRRFAVRSNGLRGLCASHEGGEGDGDGDGDGKGRPNTIVPVRSEKARLADKKPRPKSGIFPAVPLFRRPLFPGVIAPIIVQDANAVEAFQKMEENGTREAGLFLHKAVGKQSFALNETEGITFNNAHQLHHIGVLGEMIRLAPRQKGIELTFLCHHRVRWKSVSSKKPLLMLRMEPVAENPTDIHAMSVRALSLQVVETLKELLQLGAFYKEQLELLLESVDVNNPYQLADLGACLTTADPQKLQEVLDEKILEMRLSKTLQLLKAELETIKVQRKINRQIEEGISKTQRRFFLMEQLKHVKRELGIERDEKEALIERLSDRFHRGTNAGAGKKGREIPKQVVDTFNDEMNKLQHLEPTAAEYNVTRNYLDWLAEVPWGIYTTDRFDIKRAQKVLNEDHYGLDDIKERILEFIAVGSLKKSVRGKILLFSGPPGVGKTSIGKSIARALDRKFYRFTVGGLSDVAEIKGHRRTYVGAMPGKCIQALKFVQSSNPVIMIDEIDKIGRGWQGDPSSALLEVLDPEQNNAFVDHYLDLPMDFSKVLFICTANVLDTIPAPLLDRMENIRLPGYVLEEKVEIAKKYLYPTARKEMGLTTKNVQMSTPVFRSLAQSYCREAGVRNLKNHVEKILRKVALKIQKDEVGKSIAVSDKNLEEFIGKPKFRSERLFEVPPPGVSMGLAWTPMGGSTMYIETIKTESPKPGFRTTGQMGDVMKESSEIAFSHARQVLNNRFPENDFFEKGFIHMHIPEGAVPKVRPQVHRGLPRVSTLSLKHAAPPPMAIAQDGPSAGVTMVTSVLSLALGEKVADDLAMTGELTLTGVVLAVGGIREKIIAAKRSGLTRVAVPRTNEKDWDELPAFIKDGIEVHFCDRYEEVFDLAFPQLKEQSQARGDLKKQAAVAAA